MKTILDFIKKARSGIGKLFQLLTFFCMFSIASFSQNRPFEKSKWISPGHVEDPIMRPCPIFKKIVTINKQVRSAKLYMTVHGIYEASINRKRVGDGYFTPGWTSYDKRLQYQEYDIKSLLKKGNNDIHVTIGEGWWRGAFGGNLQRNHYGNDASLLLQLDIEYTDGNKEQIVSDNSWHTSTGTILHSDIYGGEIIDARVTSKKWFGVNEAHFSKDNLVETGCEPVKKQEQFKPVKIFTTAKNEQVIDFGQNISGWVKFKVRGAAGDTIKISHAEVLDKEGNFYTGNLRKANTTDIYILKGGGEEVFEPHFTYHGFRYIKVEGCKATTEKFTAIALYTAMERSGTFSCSDPTINQLQSNINWSLSGNFFDIPTDCPQRSERLGWTGDAQVFCRTASFNRNIKYFFTKWLKDLSAEQGNNGGIAVTIPRLGRNNTQGVAGWADAATIIPWTLYWVYADTLILKEQYASMKAWVDYIQAASKGHLWTANGYGDWLAPGDSTSLPYINQCFWAYSTQLLINTASVLNKRDDVIYYTSLLKDIKTAFLKNYFTIDGKPISQTQTAYVLALHFDLLPDSLKKSAIEDLVSLIQSNNNHLSTGFLGTAYLLHVLSNNGYTDVAYDLLNQDTYPSWLYPIKMGATTMWEKWDAIKPDGTVQATSYNHYAYGAVGDWLYRVVAGIDAIEAGYKIIKIEPKIGGGLSWVKASYQCKFGKIVSEWNVEGNKVVMHVEIPVGTTAVVYIPGKEREIVGPGKYDFVGKIN